MKEQFLKDFKSEMLEKNKVNQIELKNFEMNDEMIKKLYLKSVFSFRNENIRRRKTLNLKIEIGEHI